MIVTGSSMPGSGDVKEHLIATCQHPDQVRWTEAVDHNPASPRWAHYALCLDCRVWSMGLFDWVELIINGKQS